LILFYLISSPLR